MSAAITSVAYCGLPPSPAEIWNRWRFDPFVVSILLGWFALHIAGVRSLRATPQHATTRELVLFCTGWSVAVLALVSPLCPLSVSLFSARATQHVVLTLLAAPLIAAARPLEMPAAAFGVAGRRPTRASERPLLAAACFAIFLWFWHSPAAYAATFASVAVYWTMHVTLFGVGMLALERAAAPRQRAGRRPPREHRVLGADGPARRVDHAVAATVLFAPLSSRPMPGA